jgi:hypothetical protein
MNKEQSILAIAEFGKRFFDKESPKTTLGTISGTTLIGFGAPMLTMPEVHMVAIGALLCAAGVGLIWYKEYKEHEVEDSYKETKEELEK